ncbi:MAG: carbohydrate kinase family protein [Candidatus Diapherotrites archaeon]|nr:carbohydrate kinase family protein [Candidatus Diapherotrites archaeon]
MDVIGIGAINMDFIMKIPRLPGKDDEVFATEFYRRFGGSAANFAVGCARLGLKTGFIGKIGYDDFGDELLYAFKEEGVDTTHVMQIEEHTGIVTVWVYEKGERSMVAYCGANAHIEPEDIDEDYIKGARHIHITSIEGPRAIEALIRAKKIAKENGVSVSIDPGCIFAEKGLDTLQPLINGVDILMPNRLEAERLSGEKELDEIVKKLYPLVDILVIKLSDKGCFVKNDSVETLVPAYKNRPVDTTGAGDAFAAGFIYGYLKGYDLKKCAEIANKCAALNIGVSGAREGMPTLRQLLEFQGEPNL